MKTGKELVQPYFSVQQNTRSCFTEGYIQILSTAYQALIFETNPHLL